MSIKIHPLKYPFYLPKYPHLSQENILELTIFNNNPGFARVFQDTYLSVKNAEITIYIYKNDLENLRGFEGLSYYQTKIKRLEKTLNQILELELEQKITDMKEQLIQKTKQLTESKEIFNENVRVYSASVKNHLQNVKQSSLFLIIQKLEKQLNGLIENLPTLKPFEILHTYSWKTHKKEEQNSLTPKIEIYLPDSINSESAIIYYNSHSWIDSQFSVDFWKKVGAEWKRDEYFKKVNKTIPQ